MRTIHDNMKKKEVVDRARFELAASVVDRARFELAASTMPR